VQDLSFAFRQPLFDVDGWRLGVQLFTYANVYGLDPDRCAVTPAGEGIEVVCDGLTWAGGQEPAVGRVSLRATVDGGRTTIAIDASCGETIRCVKLLLVGVPAGEIVTLRETPRRAIPPEGLRFRYPDGWRGLYAPLAVLRTADDAFLSFRSLDDRVREKRFAFLPREGGLDVELIFEEAATAAGTALSVPPWELARPDGPEPILAEHAAAVARDHGLLPWEERPDVPAWAREVSLVAAVHCQHWTGYVFNPYDRVLETIGWLAERIDPKRLLVFLPGWEGRYYWQYGDYRPDPRLGGEAGLARLAEGARAAGVRLMPMFGINHANRGLANFERWGAPALATTAGGLSGGGTVDWDGSRHHDHGWGALLNPGAPTWQNRLVEQVGDLVDRYGFDGVFLDISAGWWNDPKHDVHAGAGRLVARLREGRPDLLVAGEGWYDAASAAVPLTQSGHTDGDLHWHDAPYPPLFDRSARSFGHLCLGDPGRGSTGVHELGHNPITRVPVRKGVIPTVTLVEDTLQAAPDRVLEIVEDAKRYAAEYLTAPSSSA
jgi:hypothetical protein